MVVKKTYLEILTHLHVFCPPDYEKVIFGIPSFHLYICTCVWMYVYMDVHLAGV
jgi:hypothetical protein